MRRNEKTLIFIVAPLKYRQKPVKVSLGFGNFHFTNFLAKSVTLLLVSEFFTGFTYPQDDFFTGFCKNQWRIHWVCIFTLITTVICYLKKAEFSKNAPRNSQPTVIKPFRNSVWFTGFYFYKDFSYRIAVYFRQNLKSV